MINKNMPHITLALYNPCSRNKTRVMPIVRVAETPEGRHFCHKVIEYFDEEASRVGAIVYNLGTFGKTHVSTGKRNKETN